MSRSQLIALACAFVGLGLGLALANWKFTEPGVLTGARLLAYPSLDEGFGHPPLEAMRAGTPVVAAAAGSLPEVLGDAAVLCDPESVGELADALFAVATDDALRTRLIAAGHVRADRWSWDRAADGLVGLYRRAVAGQDT